MSRDGSLPPGCSDLADTLQRVRVMDRTGRQVGIMLLSEAMKIADHEHVELVKITKTAIPPVYRMIESEAYQKIIKKRPERD